MDIVARDSVNVIFYSRKEIFLLLQNCSATNCKEITEYLEAGLSKINECRIQLSVDTSKNLPKLLSQFKKLWRIAARNKDRFLQRNKVWLEKQVTFIKTFHSEKICKAGRNALDFTACSDRTKRRRTEDMRKQYSAEELSYGTQMSLRSAGKVEASKVVKQVTLSTPTRALKYQEAFAADVESPISGREALSIVTEAKLSKSQYNVIKSCMTENKCKLFPSYNQVQKAKQECYPARSAITITENSAEVKLQELLDHTCERTLLVQKDVLRSQTLQNINVLDFIIKWGFDGSSSQSEYKQSFSSDIVTDSSVFVTSLVPLQLIGTDIDTGKKCIVWKNPRPSSPRFCRPIRLQFITETAETSLNEMKYIENQISSLVPYTTVHDNKIITIHYKLTLTMVDGKVCNALTATSSTQRCYLCGSTSKDFNDIDKMLQLDCKSEHLTFGLSILHTWIRLFECLLHLSYKLGVQKWQVRNTEEKKIVAERKLAIQKKMRSKLGLIVDHPKHGFGNSNDGNTARRFFQNAELSAAITGLDEIVINKFYTILQVISSGYEIKIPEFQAYCLEAARDFVSKYPWYYMPPTLHKLLIHGPQIIQSALLPIGQLSEEAQEARNKDFRRYRRENSRKCSREKTVEDVFNWLLVSSDPLITSQRKLPKIKKKNLSSDVISFLNCPDVIQSEDVDDSASDCD